MKSIRFLATAIAATTAVAALAQAPTEVEQQRLEKSHHIVYFGQGENADSSAYQSLISQFYQDQFRHSQDPRAPYFMMMSRNGQMAMGVGGTLNLIGAYSWDGSIDGLGFIPYDIPIPVDPTDRTSLQASPSQSALFFTVFGKDRRFGNYQLYVEAKFSGANNAFKLSKAYATVGDWTLGYANTTFTDPAAQPATVETQGPNSELGGKSVLLRYMHTFKKHFTMAVSAETLGDQVPSLDGKFQSCTSNMPDLAAFAQWQWGGNQHLRLSGIVRSLRYRDLIEGKNHSVAGWGLHLSTIFRPVAPLTVYGAVNTGKGIGSLVNDLAEGNNDLLGRASEPGKMYAPQSFGWYAALQYNYSPSVFSTVMFSQERMLPGDNVIADGSAYRYGWYATANTFWDITPRCQVGAEINVGKRCNADGSNHVAYRAGLLAQFSF